MNATKIKAAPRLYLANIGQCAENHQTFCTKNDDYPLDHIQKLLQDGSDEFEEFFRVHDERPTKAVAIDVETVISKTSHTNVLSSPTGLDARSGGRNSNVFRSGTIPPFIYRSEDATTLASRILGGDEDQDDENVIQMCDSYEKVIYPTSGQSESGPGLYIFNTVDKKQGVRVSMCSDPGQECENYASFRNGYKSECQQQNIQFELLSLSPEGKMVKNRFGFPATCSCVVVKIN